MFLPIDKGCQTIEKEEHGKERIFDADVSKNSIRQSLPVLLVLGRQLYREMIYDRENPPSQYQKIEKYDLYRKVYKLSKYYKDMPTKISTKTMPKINSVVYENRRSLLQAIGATREEIKMVEEIDGMIDSLRKTPMGEIVCGAWGLGCGGVIC